MEFLTESSNEQELIDVDEDRLNELIQLAKQYYPLVPEYFLSELEPAVNRHPDLSRGDS